MIKEEISCSMCGAVKTETNPIVSNGTFSICGNCINTSHELIKDLWHPEANGDFGKKTPSKIVEFVNQYVIGQDSAKKTLALAIYNHYKRMSNTTFDNVELQKSNILMIGPSGVGKTYLIQSIARFLDIPFAIADATSLSSTGFIGEDCESMLHTLIQSANGDVEKAKYGIVYIDELDKTAKRTMGSSSNKDPSGEGVQQTLLKIIEGTISKVPVAGGRKVSGDNMHTIDTTHILFICGGAFVDLDVIMKKKDKNTNTIGFSANNQPVIAVKRAPQPEDLYKFGMLPELIGRLPIICTLDDLTVEDLTKILVEPKNSILKQFKALVSMEGATLEFTDQAINKIAQLSFERKTGARGLRSIVEETLNNHMFNLPDMDNVKTLLVDVVDDDLVCNFIVRND